ncbi:MAG: hypothetical protein IT462_00120 [Planctomycetes bacterium]|nr:hypothetical protein [Planctomycetota bacterium]
MRTLRLIPATAVMLLWAVSWPHVQAEVKSPPMGVPDRYNLSVIGGKAEDYCGDALPENAKRALHVKTVVAEWRGAKAGLMAEDVIYGAGGKVFEKNAYLELADAIEAAESQTEDAKAQVVLKVQRTETTGSGKTTKSTTRTLEVTVAMRVFGEGAGKTIPGAALEKDILERGAKWLAGEQQADGSFFTTLSVENGLVVLTSIAGMALMAAGNTAEEGKYSAHVLRAAEFVMETVGVQKKFKMIDGKRYDQTNWSLGYGGLFLAWVYERADKKWLGKSSLKRLKNKLEWVRDRILANMEDSGGFAAGPGGPNALGYVELEVMSNFVLASLGAIKAVGISVDDKKLEKAVAYVRACAGETGGVGYSTRPGEIRQQEVGRTAGAANAFAALGLTADPLYDRMQKFVQKHVARAFGGHSTPTMHQLSVAIASYRAGPEAWEEYWRAQRREFTMVRSEDGAFSYRPTEDTKRLNINLDRDLTRVWTTAHWLLILRLDDGAVPLWVAKPK